LREEDKIIMENKPVTQNQQEESLDFSSIFNKIVSHYYYFLISIPLFLFIAYFYLRYAPYTYESSAKILLEKKKDNKASGLDDVLVGIDLFGNVIEVANEIEKIGSFKNALKTSKKLEKITLVGIGNLKQAEIYPVKGISIEFDTTLKVPYGKRFNLTIIDQNRYKISSEFFLKDSSIVSSDNQSEEFTFENGKPVRFKNLGFTISYSDEVKPSSKYFFILHSEQQMADKILKDVKIAKYNKEATIIELKIKSQNIAKQTKILNEFCDSYVELILEDKNEQARRTVEFINEQLTHIFDSLAASQLRLEKFKQNNSLFDLGENAKILLNEVSKVQENKFIKESQINYYHYLLDAITKKISQANEIISPSLQGVQDNLLTQLISELIELNKIRKLKISQLGMKAESYEIRNLDKKIEEIQKNIVENVNGLVKVAENERSILESKVSMLNKEIARLPASQRNLVNIERDFKLNETIFNFLIEKKYEAQIALASNSPDAYVLEYAREESAVLVFPKTSVIYILALTFAIILPISYLLLLDVIDDKIYVPRHIESISSFPVLGKIPHTKKDSAQNEVAIRENPKSSLAEAFRSLRINLEFLASGKNSKVIAITSTAPGEGKTFCAFNLAVIHAMGDKKTLLIGADMRKPKIASYLQNIDSTVGLSNYLIGKQSLESITHSSGIPNLFVIPSGDIPPNPAELLSSAKFDELIEQVRSQYEVIIIDNAPIGLVSDYFALAKHLDLTLFVARQAYSRKGFIREVDKLAVEGRINNLSYILNDVGKSSKYGYGSYGYGYGSYGYGYGYGYGYTKETEGYYVEATTKPRGWRSWFKRKKS
jgi:capsular exopolysaccharide synthesis family protein